MSENNKVIWSEGLFLRPQHFQQEERYLERFVDLRSRGLRGHGWGFTDLALERDLLAVGKLGIKRACGVFPDGTPFAIPEDDPTPPPLEIDPAWRDQTVFLTVPLRSSVQMEAARDGEMTNGLTRFRVREIQVRDTVSNSDNAVPVEVGGLACRLLPECQPMEGLGSISLTRIVERRADGRVVLDDGFMPSAMRVEAVGALVTFVTELAGLLHQRGEALAQRVALSGRGAAAEIAEFLLLQAVNRNQPIFEHLAGAPMMHPEELFGRLAQLAGELATFTTNAKRPPRLAPYRHEALRESFEPLMHSLRASLSAVIDQTAVAIPIEQRRYGVWVATCPDRQLFETASFVLAVQADMNLEKLRRLLPTQAKVGPVEKIRDLVNLQLRGVPLSPMPTAPREIPYNAGAVYFEFDKTAPLWRDLIASGGIAFHFGNQFPGLEAQLWAIRV